MRHEPFDDVSSSQYANLSSRYGNLMYVAASRREPLEQPHPVEHQWQEDLTVEYLEATQVGAADPHPRGRRVQRRVHRAEQLAERPVNGRDQRPHSGPRADPEPTLVLLLTAVLLAGCGGLIAAAGDDPDKPGAPLATTTDGSSTTTSSRRMPS